MSHRDLHERGETAAVARSTLWQVASQCAMAALSIVTVKFVAIGLTKELFGYYNSTYGYLQLFGILADFGLYTIAVREVSRTKHRGEVLGALIALRLMILMLSLGLALSLVWLHRGWHGTPLPLGVTIAALVPFFTLLAGIIRTVFQVSYKMHYVFIAEVLHRVLTVGCIGGAVLLGTRMSGDLRIYYSFLAVGGAGAFLLFVLFYIFGNRLVHIRPYWNTELLWKLARQAFPYGLAFFCVAAYRQLDVTLIALLRPDFEFQNAYYGPVVRMMDMAFLLPTFLLNSVLPMLTRRHARGDETRSFLGKTFLLVLLIGSISALFAFIWSGPLVELLLAASFIGTPGHPGSDTALRLLALPMWLNGIILYSFYVLLTANAWRPLILILASGAALSLGLNIMLIPTLGFVGACYASIAANTFLAMTLFPTSLRAMRLHFPLRSAFQWAFFTCLLAVFLLLIRPYLIGPVETVLGLAAAAAALLGIAYATGLLRTLRF